MGQAHNILRHPDMPEEAFRDFWDTIQKGRIWSNIIKNRRKNGDTYWVRANATPMKNGDKVVGYLSVRTQPHPEEIEQAEILFSKMRKESNKKYKAYTFKNGLLINNSIIARMGKLFKPDYFKSTVTILALAILLPLLVTKLPLPEYVPFIIAVLCLIASLFGIKQALFAPRDVTQEVAKQVASGDLSRFVRPIESGFMRNIVLPISQMALATRTVMVDVRNDIYGLSKIAQDIAGQSEELATHTEQQSASLQQTATAMEQINSTVNQTSDITKEGLALANEASNEVLYTNTTMQDLSNVMGQISDSSKSIAEFIQTIEAVAFQTNILALNASVEAARAGEQGRGFAVVANEVRALAQKTSGAAKDIKDLIDVSLTKVNAGNENVIRVNELMGNIVTSVDKVKTALGEINNAASEQAKGVAEVNTSLQQLGQITQSNAAMSEELATAATNMNTESSRALDNLRVFRISAGDITHAEDDAVALRKEYKALAMAL